VLMAAMCTCLAPLPRRSDWACCFAHSPRRVSLPQYGSRVGLRIDLLAKRRQSVHLSCIPDAVTHLPFPQALAMKEDARSENGSQGIRKHVCLCIPKIALAAEIG
jgi:hypothetical protein